MILKTTQVLYCRLTMAQASALENQQCIPTTLSNLSSSIIYYFNWVHQKQKDWLFKIRRWWVIESGFHMPTSQMGIFLSERRLDIITRPKRIWIKLHNLWAISNRFMSIMKTWQILAGYRCGHQGNLTGIAITPENLILKVHILHPIRKTLTMCTTKWKLSSRFDKLLSKLTYM